MIETRHTPGCASTESPWISARDRNRGRSEDVFHYAKCPGCGLIRLTDVPADLFRYYSDDYYELPQLERLKRIARSNPFKIDLARRFARGPRLLEIGPAQGVFALQAKQAGFHVDAIEMDARCCEYLSSVVGVNAICSAAPHDALATLPPYDVIAAWHVIEHVADPWALLVAAARNLNAGGILILAAPNPDAWQFRVMGAEWPHLDAPRHLYLLPEAVISEFVAAAGLQRIHFSSTDADSKRWNRFGWQRLLMNGTSGKWLRRAAYLGGFAVSAAAAPFEAADPKGSTYTMVFRKAAHTVTGANAS